MTYRFFLLLFACALCSCQFGNKSDKQTSGQSTANELSDSTATAAKPSRPTRVRQMYIAGSESQIALYDIKADTLAPADTVARGTLVKADPSKTKRCCGLDLVAINLSGQKLMVPKGNLAFDISDAVRETTMFVRTAASVIDTLATSHICGLVAKGSRVNILGFDSLQADGHVHRYLISQDSCVGYVFGKYLTLDSLSATQNYRAAYYDSIHSAIIDKYGAGNAIDLDYYPVSKPVFQTPIPNPSYALYLNINAVGRIDSFIELAKQTRINTIVLDIKDNECPGFPAETFRLYSPTNYKWGGQHRRTRLYEYAVQRLHEEGLYAVGRITVFKDSYFVRDNPEVAITDRETGKPFFHNNAHWPSAFDRRVWQFNVSLAKEAVRRFCFDEINFDYVRFPDRMQSVADQIDYHNLYNESMVQAIQRFVQYATDEIHEVGAYVSIDVFGESANKGYTTAYAQYWPALSNVADVICAMPYPDHFAPYSFGKKDPWNHPYHTLSNWAQRAAARQEQCPTPAIARTWVQAYKVLRYVDRRGIDYDAHAISEEVRALYDNGLTGGYITWLSTSSLSRYRSQKAAFEIDYYAEWLKKVQIEADSCNTEDNAER